MTNLQEIVKILTDSGIEPNEAAVEVKLLLEHFANYGLQRPNSRQKVNRRKHRVNQRKGRT